MESFAAVLMFKINIFCYKAFELFGLFQTCVELTEPARPKGNQDIVHHTWKKVGILATGCRRYGAKNDAKLPK